MRQRPDLLIVPIRDRRQGRRILTLRNLGIAALTVFVLFIAITLLSERGRGPSAGDYGRLYRHELPPAPQPAAPLPIVNEANPVNDHASADPLLSAPAERAQWIEPAPSASIEPIATAPPVTLAPRAGNARVAIVGGPAGVAAVEQKPQPQKQLKGGIFRQP